MMMFSRCVVVAIAVTLAACGADDGETADAGDSAGPDEGAETDADEGDAGPGDAGTDATGAVDTGAADTGAADTGEADTGTADTGEADTGTADTGAADTGAADTGAADTGVDDTADTAEPDVEDTAATDGDVGGADGGPDPLGDIVTELPITVVVDESIEPQVRTWPPVSEGGEPRPVAGIVGHGGRVSSFVADELLVTYTDPAELDAFVQRWSGEILAELDMAAAGLPEVPNMALVRVDASAADVDDFVPGVRELAPTVSGDYAVSSEAALKLLTAAVSEARAGVVVGINWIGESTGILERDVQESATSTSLVDHNPNPFGWNYMRAGGPQDIGVTEAWRALTIEEKIGNRVRIAILDGGFAPDADFPTVYEADSVVFWKSATDSTNPGSCSGDEDCEYHGTVVMHTAAAQVDNDFGTAGTGGPVAEGISIVTTLDAFNSIAAMNEAVTRGAHIINMSFHMVVPSILGFSILPQELTTSALSKSGVMLFASAGNSGESVDSEECFAFCIPFTDYCWKECFETYWFSPCENEGVVCVGGLAANSRKRAGNSNFGIEDVRMFAPFRVLVGAAPDNADPIRWMSGTSFSTPYVAGVAALVKAADPALTGQQVIEILHDTAHGSGDPVVPAYVNALGAVMAALGNVRPTVRIVAPGDGADFGALGPDGLTFVAATEDYEDGIDTVSVSWEADPDGFLGDGHVLTAYFTTPGVRTITATATDSDGKTSTASIQIEIVNEPPSLTVSGPFWPETTTVGVPFVVAAQTWDPESFSPLPCTSVTWEIRLGNAPAWQDLGSGCSKSLTLWDTATAQLNVTATDDAGATGEKGQSLKALPLPASGPPYVSIIEPGPGIGVEPLVPLTLVGTAVDPDDPEGVVPLTYEWTGKQAGEPAFPIGTSPIVEWTPDDDVVSPCGAKSVELTLKVTDGGGEVTLEKVTITVFYPPC